jgi:hypothetical protein
MSRENHHHRRLSLPGCSGYSHGNDVAAGNHLLNQQRLQGLRRRQEALQKELERLRQPKQ